MKKCKMFLLLLGALLLLSGCGAQAQETADENQAASATDSASESASAADSAARQDEMFTSQDLDASYDAQPAAQIALSGESAAATGGAVEISGGTIRITGEGTYVLSGALENGMVIIDAPDTATVRLALNGANITSPTSAAIYVRAAGKTIVTTAAQTENRLSNGGEYVAIDDNNIDSVIFSKDDLTLNGEGTLIIDAAAGHGAVCKDDLILGGGSFSINSSDDALHSNGDLTLSAGEFDIATGDDGVHADAAVTVSGGSIRISQSYEGIEGLTLDIAGGEISIVSSDDGLNAAGGNDESGMGGFGGRGRDRFSATEGAYINISGGVLNIDASGDGIDSNGELTVSGGEIYVAGPTSGGDSALDYDGEAVISGGVLVATGSASMAQSFGAGSTQGVIMASVQSDSEDGVVALYDSEGNQLLSHQMNKRFSNVVISCPEIVEGGTYTLQTGGQTTQITMDGLIYGDSGMGRGGFGGRGGGNDRKSGRGGEWG